MSETQNISMTTTLNLSNVLVVCDEERLEYIQHLQNQTTIIMIPAMIFLIIVAFVGFIGNSLVLFVYHRKFQQNPTRILIMVIAMFDLVSNVLAIPGEIYDMFHIWDFDNPALCRARLFVNAFVTLSNAIALIVVAVVRYRKVCNPHGWQITTTQAKRISVAVVFLGALISTPYVITNGRQTKQTQRPGIIAYECSEDDSYKDTIWPLVNNTFFLILFMAAFLSLLILYLRIGLTTWRHRKLFRKYILEVTTDSEYSHAESRSSVCTDREIDVQNMPENLQQDVSEEEHTTDLQRNCQISIKASLTLKVNCEVAIDRAFNREPETEVGYDCLRHIQTQNEAMVEHSVSGKCVDIYKEVCQTEVNNDLSCRTERGIPLKALGASKFADTFKEASKVEIQDDFYKFQKENEKRPRENENYVVRFDTLSKTSNENYLSYNVESQKYSTLDTEGNVNRLKAEFETQRQNDSLCKIQVQTEAQVTSSVAEDSGDYFDKLSEIKPKVDAPCNVLTQDQTNLTARLDCECIDHVKEVSETELKTDSLHTNQTQTIITQTPLVTCGYSDNNCKDETVTQIKDDLNIKLNEVSDTERKHDSSWQSQGAAAQTPRMTCEYSNNTNNVIVTKNKDGLTIEPEGASKCKPQNEESSSCDIKRNIKYIANRTKIRKINTRAQTGHARTELVNRTTIIVIIISAVYCVCFVPYIGLSFFTLLDHEAYIGLNLTEASFFNLFYRFYFINSAANPIVYNLFGRNFRQACRKLIGCRSRADG